MTKTPWMSERTAVAQIAREMAAIGLVSASSGNVSLRIAEPDSPPLLAITPMGKPYHDLKDEGASSPSMVSSS